ncbi:pyruvate formate-lyase-activating protein [Microbacterium dextranolyticum]|uniref:Pyruvate formate-lyase-activating enzyme n=2 Tax=Microbacterium dextranolyticum TaxID=36806 RepID=A0A9W6M7H1_9MICO|nr:pyruvate formate-lyase-activating protein [Microbacterium dextranolyticum]GLJ96543.1 pyruvate formate-lyase-activating enzyme [Microbacterium dextranolyticum]
MAATMLRRHACNVVPSSLPDDAVRLEVPLPAPAHRRAGAGLDGLETSDVDHHERLTAMREGRLGSVHSWELVTAVDGPGTRLTTFLSGCPLQCLYCHNPDTMAMKEGSPVTSDELLARIARYTAVFRATGGGITLSGGEVLMQPAFAARILRGAKELGIHTALDTSGYLGAAATDQMLDDTDLVLLDVKSGDPDTYRRVTSRELAPTLAFGRRLAERADGPEVWIRFVLVPGLTDDPDNIEKVAEYAASLNEIRPGTVSRVEVLPFHQMGRDKWASLGRTYELDGTEPPTAAATESVRERFRAHGLTTY